MFISQAFAQEAGAAATEGSFLVSIAPLVLIFIIFYFLVIRPQSKRMKDHQEMLGALSKGDKVITGGGVFGTIKKTDDRFAIVEVAKGVEIKVLRATITGQQDDFKPKTEEVKK